MSESEFKKVEQKPNLKIFFIKLISIAVVIVITINLIFNVGFEHEYCIRYHESYFVRIWHMLTVIDV